MAKEYFNPRDILEKNIIALIEAGFPRDVMIICLTLRNRNNNPPMHIEDIFETVYDLWDKSSMPKTSVSQLEWEDEKDTGGIASFVLNKLLLSQLNGPKIPKSKTSKWPGLSIVNGAVVIPPASKWVGDLQVRFDDHPVRTFLPPYRTIGLGSSLGAFIHNRIFDAPSNQDAEIWTINYIGQLRDCEKHFDQVLAMVSDTDKCIMLTELYYLNGHPAYRKRCKIGK